MDLLSSLNQAQRQAVTHVRGPLLIVAGAGTGKTTVLARRFVWLMEAEKLSADRVVTLTFTDKAAQEMEDRVLQLLPNGTYDFWISTFHAFCQRILEEFALEIGLPHRFRLLSETDTWLLMKRHLDELPLDHYRPLGNPVKFLGALMQHISRAKDEGVTAERYLEFARDAALDGDAEFVTGERKRLMELADCYATYRYILRQEGCLDFGDLIVETLRLLRERPGVLKRLRERFKYVMVDEFQDTNWAQYELVKLLAGEEKNITVVGDDDQAIYKFRGASLANILQFRDDYPEAEMVALTDNYRSRQEILDVAYRFIKKNDPYRLEIKLQDQGLSKKLTAAKGEGGAVSALWYRSLDEEAEAVVRRIKELRAKETELKWDEIAILVRSNDGATPFIHALERHGVPYRFYALRGLYSRPVVVDVTSLLRAAVQPHDSTILWRVMTMASAGFPAKDIAEFVRYASRKGISIWQALKIAPNMKGLDEHSVKRAAQLVTQIEGLAEAAKREPPLKVLQLALDKTGYLVQLLKLPEGEKIDAIHLLNSFASRIKRYEAATHAPTLPGFLNELQLEIDSGEEGALQMDPDAGPELVKVLTVHASKGLEFKHVFVVSLVDQRFPTRERSDAIALPEGLVNERLPEGDAHLSEERRLFYVAVTRAKETLSLTGASDYGGTRKKKPSQFFVEAECKIEEATVLAGETISLTPAEVVLLRETSDREVFALKHRFSFTQLSAFRKCPLQYKFAHVYKIPILGSYQKSFGQSVHLALHEILKRHTDRGLSQQTSLFDADALSRTSPAAGFRVSQVEALEIFEGHWIDEWYTSRAEHDKYKQEGRAAIKRLWEMWNERPPNVKTLEQSFDWRIGDHSIKGAVDRIDELENGGLAIYDYKTGQPRASGDLETSDKEQLRLYQVAMEERGMIIKKLAYVYVRDGSEAEVEIIQGEKRQAFIEDIRGRMSEILLSNFSPSPSPFICKYCDFRNVCEYRKL